MKSLVLGRLFAKSGSCAWYLNLWRIDFCLVRLCIATAGYLHQHCFVRYRSGRPVSALGVCPPHSSPSLLCYSGGRGWPGIDTRGVIGRRDEGKAVFPLCAGAISPCGFGVCVRTQGTGFLTLSCPTFIIIIRFHGGYQPLFSSYFLTLLVHGLGLCTLWPRAALITHRGRIP